MAIDSVLGGMRLGQLGGAARRLSERYHGPRTGDRLTQAEIEAYVAVRLPATFAALIHVCREAAWLEPAFAPASQLDLGAGTGSAAWAAAATWPSITRVSLLDQDERMLHLGRRLRAADPRASDATWTWRQDDFTRAHFDEPHDLVTLAYAFGDLDATRAVPVARAAWAATRGLLVIVEPGTPVRSALVRELRRVLIDDGAALLAPCPHDRDCPMAGHDWCHFAARVQRSALHRQVKGAELPYEDEKFSYVAFTRIPSRRAPARVVRHPTSSPRRITFLACLPTGLAPVHVTRSHPDYRAARRLKWGSALPHDFLSERD
jgi:ribosomal protein RSM22 (predicted rRNA methylase)